MSPFGDMTNKGGETRKEIRLAKKGNIHDLQQYRAKRFYKYIRELIPFRAIVQVEQNLRKWVQKEIHLTQKNKGQSSDDQILQKQLSEINEQYWLNEREWWKWRDSFTEGPLTRGFDLWRSHQRWYLHRSLIEDCSATALLNVDVAIKLGEVSSPKKGKQIMEKIFPLDGNTKRVMQLERVSIWGLLDGNKESPFDLIDEPPIYEKSQLKSRKSD
ncbi:hypothetical protein N7510_004324 [Penicillium lagena]|uniref:uncharacterized protein n=1 Tax=Penicillium lagena TaxID=94218 RepID=UPI00254251A6|nr:uncharacterized protein N7510_004324 [Penicillium lagena]KAJ5620340.1 hypothetical protein N7510_004324 [Penicillium lagena]